MRIAYVCTDPGVPVFGRKGCSVHVREILRAFLKQGAQIDVFAARLDGECPSDLEPLGLRQLPVWTESRRAARPAAAVEANTALRAALDRTGPFDLVYERYSLWSTSALDYARTLGISGVLEVNAPLIEEEARYRGLTDHVSAVQSTRQAFSTASTVIVVSSSIIPYVRQYRDQANGVHVLPNGVDPVRFSPGSSPSLPAPDGVFTVGFLGSLKPWHGVMTLADAFRQLHRMVPNTRFLVVGDGPERERVREYLSTHRLRDATTFTGAVDSSEIPGLLASMDVGTAPYSSRPDFYFSPLKLYEYMAAGLAVAASKLGQIAEVIEDGIDGLLCQPDDAAALARALLDLRADPALRRRLASAARQKVLRHNSWDAIALRILSFARTSEMEARA